MTLTLLQWLHASPIGSQLAASVDDDNDDGLNAPVPASQSVLHNPNRRTLTSIISPVDLIATMGSLFGKFLFNQLLDSMSDFLHSLLPGRG